jgi:hypothetical protein
MKKIIAASAFLLFAGIFNDSPAQKKMSNDPPGGL